MATKITRINRLWKGEGVPIRSDWGGFSGLSKNDEYEDQLTGKRYHFNGSGFDLKQFHYGSGGTGTGEPGTPGKDATVQIGTVNTSTLPAGSSATVSVTDSNPSASDATLNFNFGIPQGQPGTGGGGTGTYVLNTMIEVVPSGGDDTANLRAAVTAAKSSMRSIRLAGVYKVSDTPFPIAKDHLQLHISGWAHINATNQNEWAFFSSPNPIDNADAEGGAYTFRRIDIERLYLNGNGRKQTGFDLKSTEGASIRFIQGNDLKIGALCPFWLRGSIERCEFNGNIEAIKVVSGSGLWLNAGITNSCSNGFSLVDNRVYSKGMTTAVRIEDASNVKIDGLVIEGGVVDIGLYYGGVSNTSTGLVLDRFHFECPAGATDHQIVIRSSTQTHILNSPGFYPKGKYLRVEGGGYPNIQFHNYSSGDFVTDGSGTKVFTHMPGASWGFYNCDDPLRTFGQVSPLFNTSGVTLREACGYNAGSNAVCVQPINR